MTIPHPTGRALSASLAVRGGPLGPLSFLRRHLTLPGARFPAASAPPSAAAAATLALRAAAFALFRGAVMFRTRAHGGDGEFKVLPDVDPTVRCPRRDAVARLGFRNVNIYVNICQDRNEIS